MPNWLYNYFNALKFIYTIRCTTLYRKYYMYYFKLQYVMYDIYSCMG